MFLWSWRSKDLVVLKFERCEHRDDTSIVDGDHEDVKCKLSFVLKDHIFGLLTQKTINTSHLLGLHLK